MGIALLLILILDGIRKDRDFLHFTFSKPSLLISADYLMLSIPFIIISLTKGEWWQSLVMLAVALLLPHIKKREINGGFCIPLPFMYRGGIDLIYSLRVIWWLFPLFIIGSVMGMLYDNINLVKVCVILWTIIIGITMRDPTSLALNYRCFRRFLTENMKMVLMDVTLLLVPLLAILACCGEGILFPLRLLISGILLVFSVVVLRYIVSNFIFLVLNYLLLIVAYGISLFSPYGYALPVVAICIYLGLIKSKYSSIWN